MIWRGHWPRSLCSGYSSSRTFLPKNLVYGYFWYLFPRWTQKGCILHNLVYSKTICLLLDGHVKIESGHCSCASDYWPTVDSKQIPPLYGDVKIESSLAAFMFFLKMSQRPKLFTLKCLCSIWIRLLRVHPIMLRSQKSGGVFLLSSAKWI